MESGRKELSDVPVPERDGPGWTRRSFLATSGKGALALGAGALILGCNSDSGGSEASGSSASAGGGTPVRGGTLTVGLMGGGSSENLYPGTANGYADWLRNQQLYDNLFNLGGEDKVKLLPGLALSADHNADATLWTFKLRDGVHWHDGKPFTADDVVYTFKTAWRSPSNYAHANVKAFVDFQGIRKRGPLEVEVPLVRPCAQFPALFNFNSLATWIVPEGSTPKSIAAHPVGTGPFKYVSFTPGQHSVFEANRDYWEHPKPYVDRLVVESGFANDAALLNALLSGQVDLIPRIPYSQARRYVKSSELKVLRTRGNSGPYVNLRVDTGPFADVRVRQAMKLMVDRKALIDQVLDGFGRVGTDDLTPLGVEYAATDLKPTHDPEKAKSLLKAAGQDGMSATLKTSPLTDGFVGLATLIAQQAKTVGINLKVDVVPPSTYFTSVGGYLKYFAYIDSPGPASSLTSFWMTNFWSQGPYNGTHWGQGAKGAANDKLLLDAIAAVDPAKATDLWHEVQKRMVEDGGLVYPGAGDYMCAVAPNVRGVKESSATGDLSGYRLLDGWLVKS